MKIKLERTLTWHRFLYFDSKGLPTLHTDRISQFEGRDEYAYVMTGGKVYRCVDGRRVLVAPGNIEWTA